MKLLRKFIKKAIAEDALPELGKYDVNLYKPKKDKEFWSYVARKNPFAYYLMQTNMPNEIIKDNPLSTRIGHVFFGSKTRKNDPKTGVLSNNDYGTLNQMQYKPEYLIRQMELFKQRYK